MTGASPGCKRFRGNDDRDLRLLELGVVLQPVGLYLLDLARDVGLVLQRGLERFRVLVNRRIRETCFDRRLLAIQAVHDFLEALYARFDRLLARRFWFRRERRLRRLRRLRRDIALQQPVAVVVQVAVEIGERAGRVDEQLLGPGAQQETVVP